MDYIQIVDSFQSSLYETGIEPENIINAKKALSQMLIKGKVSAEEMSQLSEALPGSYSLFAEAFGTPIKEFVNELKQGNVKAEELLPKVNELLKDFHRK